MIAPETPDMPWRADAILVIRLWPVISVRLLNRQPLWQGRVPGCRGALALVRRTGRTVPRPSFAIDALRLWRLTVFVRIAGGSVEAPAGVRVEEVQVFAGDRQAQSGALGIGAVHARQAGGESRTRSEAAMQQSVCAQWFS